MTVQEPIRGLVGSPVATTVCPELRVVAVCVREAAPELMLALKVPVPPKLVKRTVREPSGISSLVKTHAAPPPAGTVTLAEEPTPAMVVPSVIVHSEPSTCQRQPGEGGGVSSDMVHAPGLRGVWKGGPESVEPAFTVREVVELAPPGPVRL